MIDCKTEILSSIPINNCCGLSFLHTLLYTSSNKHNNSSIIINAKPEILAKAEKVITNFYPSLSLSKWENFLYVEGNLFDLHLDEEFNLNNFDAECDRLTIVKTLFLIYGNLYYNQDTNGNSKGYNLEFVLKDEKFSHILSTLLKEFEFNFKSIVRQNNFVLYTKNSNQICDFLVRLSATKTALDIQNNLTIREVRNSTNRQNNCFEGNLEKTINSSQQQLRAINYIMDNLGLDYLDENLREVALSRIANPDASLETLKKVLNNNISRAGIKYRLDKIIQIYQKFKGEK